MMPPPPPLLTRCILLLTPAALQPPHPSPPPPSSQVAGSSQVDTPDLCSVDLESPEALQRYGVVVLRGVGPAALVRDLCAKAEQMQPSFSELDKLATQPDGLRRSFVLGNSKRKQDCLAWGANQFRSVGIACPDKAVRKPALILTKPGAAKQDIHDDTDGAKDAWSIILALTRRRFCKDGLKEPIDLEPGDAIIFNGCHGGAALDKGMPWSYGLHMYGGNGVQDEHLTSTTWCGGIQSGRKKRPREA